MNKDITSKKLAAARNLMRRGMPLPALGLILEVSNESPESLDETLLATVPLFRAVIEEFIRKDDNGGS